MDWHEFLCPKRLYPFGLDVFRGNICELSKPLRVIQ